MPSRFVLRSALLLIAFLLGGCANAPATAQASGLARIAQSQVLTIGFREDSRPFSFRGTDGAPAGYSVELCKRVAASLRAQLKLSNLDVKWVPVTVATRMQAVTDGTVDLECGSTSRTLGREKTVDFSNPIWVDLASFVSPASAPLRGLPELHGRRVGVVPGTTTETALKALSERGVVPVLVPVKTHTEGIAALRENRIEAYATDRLILVGEVMGSAAGPNLVLSDDYLSVESYAVMMRRDAELRLAVNRALSEIYRSGEISTVFRQAFGSGSVPSPILEAAYLINALPE